MLTQISTPESVFGFTFSPSETDEILDELVSHAKHLWYTLLNLLRSNI